MKEFLNGGTSRVSWNHGQTKEIRQTFVSIRWTVRLLRETIHLLCQAEKWYKSVILLGQMVENNN